MINVIYRPDESYIRYARELQYAANGIPIRFLTRYFYVQIPLRMQIRGHYFAMQEADYKHPMNKKTRNQTMATPSVVVDNGAVSPAIFSPWLVTTTLYVYVYISINVYYSCILPRYSLYMIESRLNNSN